MVNPHRAGAGRWLVAPALVWSLVFCVVPLLTMTVVSFWKVEGFRLVADWSAANYGRLLGEAYFWAAMSNSLQITAIVVVTCIILAYPFAWIIAEYVPPRWQTFALLGAILPFWTSYLIRSYSWALVLASNGIVNKTLLALGLISDPVPFIYTRMGTIIGFVHFFVMLQTLTIYINLKQINPNLRRAAMDLGAGAPTYFFRVLLPLTVPGVAVGAFLTFVFCIGDFVTPQVLGGNKELTIPQLIMLQISRNNNYPGASAAALCLMLLVVAVYQAFSRHTRLDRLL